jgi:hypothetical protein
MRGSYRADIFLWVFRGVSFDALIVSWRLVQQAFGVHHLSIVEFFFIVIFACFD